MEDGVESRKILGIRPLRLAATCVCIPVFVGHAEAVHAAFERPIPLAETWQLLSAFHGISLIDEHRPGGYATPLDCEGNDPVYVSRVRRDPSVPNGLSLWVVADNIRKGAALNAVQIAEGLASQKAITPRRQTACRRTTNVETRLPSPDKGRPGGVAFPNATT